MSNPEPSNERGVIIRGVFPTVVAFVFSLSLSTAAAPLDEDAPNSLPTSPTPATLVGPPPGLADRDGDGLSDSLQAKLATLSPGEKIDVVVIFDIPGRAPEAARQSVGPFQVRREFQLINGFAASMTAAQAFALSRTPGVFRVQNDSQVTATLDGASEDFGANNAKFDYVVDGSGTLLGRPVGVCVADTGFHAGHEQ